MKIKKIEVCGFKSFVDKTVVHIDHDITAVIGPNGCGKSNIVDAIRWAMGEQSARHLRGKAMEDVIFNGCETRGPHSFAEVTLTFDNADGEAPPEYRDYAEIAVTRRLDRSGRSDYLINRTPVRLMDVTQLFLGTGVGTKAYSIIEQGRIGFIVSAKPTDRRHLIEEAAGITKFKAKKKAAERKMGQTRQNLLRIGDIVAEIEKNLASLKRQAQKAERYKRYRAESRDLELTVASHRWMELHVTQRVLREQIANLSAKIEGSRFALRHREAELTADRLLLSASEKKVETAQRSAYELDNEVRLLEGRIESQNARLEGLRESERMAERELQALTNQREALAKERDALANALVELEEIEVQAADSFDRESSELDRRKLAAEEAEQMVNSARSRVAEAQARIARAEAVLASFERRRQDGRQRLERLRSEREELEARAIELTQSADELKARLTGLRSGKDATASRKEELEEQLGNLREEIQTSDRRVEKLRSEVAEKRSRLRSLEEIQQRFEGVGEGVRTLMTRYAKDALERQERGVLGLVADRIECSEALTEALAAALGERLQHVVVRDVASAEQAVSFLNSDKFGRATLIPQMPTFASQGMVDLPAHPGIRGWLKDLVTVKADDETLAKHLLQGVLVVENADVALALRSQTVLADIVTLDGQLYAADGSRTGGRGEGLGAHMIAVKREIRALHRIVTTLDAELQSAVARHGELRNAIAERRAALDSARTQAHDAEIGIVKAEKDLRRAEEELERTRTRIERVAADSDELAADLAEAGDEEREARDEIDAAREARLQADEARAAGEEVLLGRKEAVEEQMQVVTTVRVRAAEAKQRAESDRGALERLDRSVHELAEREVRLCKDIDRGAQQQGETAAHLVLAKERLGEAVTQALEAHDALGARRTEYDATKEKLGQQEADLTAIRRTIEGLDKESNERTLSDRDVTKDLEYLLATMEERHRVDLPRVLGDYHDRPLPDEAVHQRIEELNRLVQRMGEINLTAIEEYEEKSQRHAYLSSQQEDLESALSQLEKAIRQMNRESRRLFRHTFEDVNARFKQVFPLLFGGGRAELKLTDPSDMLETGVEIIAQPPGKRLGSIELMSGGEKALTAVSLIFSIFQHRPSPFCLLDEVDAPLDEANIARFAEAIRSMTKHSQFIVITHSKATMQMADVLYGVTMETPGISKLVSVELQARRAQKALPEAETVAVA